MLELRKWLYSLIVNEKLVAHVYLGSMHGARLYKGFIGGIKCKWMMGRLEYIDILKE